MKSNLNPFELYTCFAIWIFTNVFILYKFYESQSEIIRDLPYIIDEMTDLQSGWSFMTRLKDTSDVEWSSFKYFVQISWAYLILQFTITEIIRKTEIFSLKYWYITSSMIFVTLFMGYKYLLLTLVQPLLYAGIVFCGGKKWSIWITSIALLQAYNSLKYRTFFWLFLDHEGMYDEEVYLILFSMPWIELRCISYCLDYVDKSKEKSEIHSKVQSLVDILSYSLYVPLLFMGPIILYDDFNKSFTATHEKLSIRLKRFIIEMCICFTYMFIMDFALHYIYFYAMHVDMRIVRMLPTLALCGGGLWMGVQFHLKYVIAYGTTTALAKLDNMATPPTPRCIARIHIYSQMWKYFDVGLYRFLVKYIYKPSLEEVSSISNLPDSANKMIAAIATFAFTFLWHGTIKRIFVWSILNYLGMSLETLGRAISETNKYKWFKTNVLKTETMETRFIAALCVPLLFISIISNFYLFAGTKVGDVFFECLYHFSINNVNTIFITVAFYCCCIVSMALQDVSSRTDSKRVNKKILSQ